ncbi:MAG TPA: response regulator [Pyrinomonadaceae bacterium]|nr:response regulator [Pyrinomonadaceae bacterium]
MSSTPGVAVAAVMIPEEQLIRVLVVDDREDFRRPMSDYFREFGYAVDLAKNPDEAKPLLEKNRYQIVLYDINFEGLNVKGDRFVLNYKNFKGARVVVVTALEVNQLRSTAELQNLDIPVWGKGDPDWGTNLNNLTEETLEARKQEIASQLEGFVRDKLGFTDNRILTSSSATAAVMAREAPVTTAGVGLAPAPWEIAVEDMLVEWLQSQDNLEGPLFSVGRTVLSANNMLDQIAKRTRIGKKLLEMFVTEVRHSLRLKPVS